MTPQMISRAYNNNDELLFPLQIWKQPHRIKCSEQLRVNKRDTDCFEHLHEENTKPLVNVSVLHAWIFLSTSGFLRFYREEGRSDGTLIEWLRDVDVLVAIYFCDANASEKFCWIYFCDWLLLGR